MQEIKSFDQNEIRTPEVENYQKIGQDAGVTLAEAKKFWDQEFSNVEKVEPQEPEFGGRYKSYEARLDKTPVNGERGSFDGERGESIFRPSDETEAGARALAKLEECGLEGIEYKNAEPDFSKCALATVKIDDMTPNRWDYIDDDGNMQYGNFSQADMKCAELFNTQKKDGREDWTASDVQELRQNPDNWYTWHERCDTKTMDLVPYDIHSYCTHSGGVAECKMRDTVETFGGGFDE